MFIVVDLLCSYKGGDSDRIQSPGLNQRSEGEILQSSNLKNFSYSDLCTATRNFRPDSVLGEGGFGCVYKGWIDEHTFAPAKPGSGMIIAVKRLNHEGYQGHREWLVSINNFKAYLNANANAYANAMLLTFCINNLS